MTDLHRMSRVLYHHNWLNVEDWAQNIAELADLTDDQIVELQHCESFGEANDRDQRRDLFEHAGCRPSIVERTRQGFLSLCSTFRFVLR
jgi:hypothetical protein